MPLALMPGTVLHELVSLRPLEQAQVLGLLLDRWKGGEHEPYWAERLTLESCRLGLEQIQRPGDDLLRELSRDRWRTPLRDSFLEAVSLHGVKPPGIGLIPSVFRIEALRHERLASTVRRAAALERVVPRLIDHLASCYLAAVSETLDLEGLRRLNIWLDEARRERERVRGMVSAFKKAPMPLRSYPPDGFDASMELIGQALECFDVRALRGRSSAKEGLRRLILQAAESLEGELAGLMRDKLEDPDFAGSVEEKKLQDLLGYWNWGKPDFWTDPKTITSTDRRKPDR